MFFGYFQSTLLAVFQILFLAGLGFFLVKKRVLSDFGLDALSKLVVEVTLPVLIFYQLIREFSFTLYPDWWTFPLISVLVNLAGLTVGLLLRRYIHGEQHRDQFLSLVTFQNSGYLPLALIAALLPSEQASPLLTYLFLFLLGFNIVVWSLGVYMLSQEKTRKFELGSLFSPAVIAILSSLVLIFFGLNKFMPEFMFKPLRMIGDCTLPLAMLVVGGSLARIRLAHTDRKAIGLLILGKLIILPALGLLLVVGRGFPPLLGLLILMQLAVPSATSLSLIVRHYKKEDLLISQGVFFTHIASIITIPLFLSLYFTLVVMK